MEQKKTPKPYLSWSQLALLEKSEYEYVVRYVYGEGIKMHPLLKLGKAFAEAVELEQEELPLDFEIAKLLMPKFEKKEFTLKGMVDDVPILGVLDGFDEKDLVIHEIKTGTFEWTQNYVDKFGQLTFYAMLVYLNYGRLPNKIFLYWIPSKLEIGEFVLTSDIKTFETKRTMEDLLDIGVRIKKAWKRIQELYDDEKRSGNIS
jgi:hypothetical protein